MKVTIGPYQDSDDHDEDFERQIEVHIDSWDTWNLDQTLALIIVPCLKQLKETHNGAPEVDSNDVPRELLAPVDYDQDTADDVDENWFPRWEWVIDEMIWAFETLQKDEHWNKSVDEIKAIDARIDNGLRLFGKYYRGLWD